jgi:hypothetical protein
MGVADQSSITGRDPLFFRFENTLQMAGLSWYIDVQNLADDRCSFYCLFTMGLAALLRLMKEYLFELSISRRNPFLFIVAMLF